jgi:hypothetical protein
MSNRHPMMITADANCAPEGALKIEHIMRNEVFHITLDWQSRAKSRVGAREAARLFTKNRVAYDDIFAAGRAAFAHIKHAAAETHNIIAYDI